MSAELFPLPEQYQELEAAIGMLTARAICLQEDINTSDVPLEQKSEFLKAAQDELDRQSMGILFGQPVEISGNYTYSGVMQNGNKLQIGPIDEYGVRRGKSNGFLGTIEYTEDDDTGLIVPETVKATMNHQLMMGNMGFTSSIWSLKGLSKLVAPVSDSYITLTGIADFRSQKTAYENAIDDKRDARWLEKIEAVVYDEQGLNFRRLGTVLSRAGGMLPGRIDDYLCYVNSVLQAGHTAIDLKCDYVIRHTPDGTIAIDFPESIVKGNNDGITFEPMYAVDRAAGLAYMTGKSRPALNLRARVGNDPQPQVVQVPLQAIEAYHLD